jgi:CRP-like cAMP-binding protein
MTKSTLLMLQGKAFLDLVSSEPPLARRVITALSQKLQTVVGVLEQLALSDFTARLAKYFLDLSLKAQRDGGNASLVRLDIRKSDLAARLGTVSESLSRSLSKLRQKGIIAVNRSEIRILDPQALARIAAGIRE